MRQKLQTGTAAPAPVSAPEPPKVQIPVDASNESTIIASAYLFPPLRSQLITKLVPDHFQSKHHRDLWVIFQAAKRDKLEVDAAFVEALGGPQLREYVDELAAMKPDEPKNIGYHVAALLDDHARATCVRGPLTSFVEGMKNPKTDRATLRALAKSIVQSFEGGEDRKFLHDPDALVRDMMNNVDERVAGRAAFGYGVESLDFFAEKTDLLHGQQRRRMLPGPAPGQTTVVTANPGIGKSTLGQTFTIGIAFPGWETGDFSAPGRKVCYGAWEQGPIVTFEALAALTLGWDRADRMQGIGPIATPEGRQELRDRAEVLKSRIRIMSNPFRRMAGQAAATNDRNLDLLQGYLADSGCRVFVGDLWQRALYDTKPDGEMQALYRQQAMAEELDIHNILLQQQRSKETERVGGDPRPSRENIKGSGAWVEIADTILGCHRPGVYRSGMPDNVFEIDVMKQRYGKWPLRVAFDWNPGSGRISNGRSVEVTRGTDLNEVDMVAGGLASHIQKGRR